MRGEKHYLVSEKISLHVRCYPIQSCVILCVFGNRSSKKVYTWGLNVDRVLLLVQHLLGGVFNLRTAF